MPRDLMTIRLDEIPERGLDLTYTTADTRLAELLIAESQGLEEPNGDVSARLELWPERVDITGTLRCTLPQVCARCLEPFSVDLEHPFDQILMRTGATAPEAVPDQEIELTLRDLDRSDLVGDEIDLGSLVREELLLAMPTKMVCTPDCKGICAGCGAELNREPCTCEEATDPRWDILKQLKFD